ncbi:MAG: PH domain-containing protein, partial [Verrucomicrobiales bacterium]|nr:PH domain-containing protein [Verrucomicrobiales bacterium]
ALYMMESHAHGCDTVFGAIGYNTSRDGDCSYFRIRHMDTGRVLLPAMLLLPLVPVWAIVMIKGIIGLAATSYAVKPSSVRQSFRFLHTDEREFAYEKITGFIIKKNLWDYLFKTLTIRLWSIGSGRSIELSHIKASQIDLPALMRQVGIPASSPQPLTNPTSFSLPTFLVARLVPVLTVACFAALLAAAAVYTPDQQLRTASIALLAVLATTTLIGFLYSWLYHRYQHLSFHPQHIEAQQGVLVRHHYFVCYRNIKKTLLTRYPGGDKGKLQFFVAGEEEVIRGKQRNQTNAGLCKPCSFTSDFLTAIRDKQHLVDDILTARVPAAPGATPAKPFSLAHESPRSAGNSVVKLLFFSLIPPVLVLLPVLLPRCIISARRWRYRVESGRVVATWGILYRHHASVLLDRIDSLQHSQGPLNKMFRNGTVTIMTAGSSKPDLTLTNTPNFNTLYEEIRQRSSSSHQSPSSGR